jgi:hypothetical protein
MFGRPWRLLRVCAICPIIRAVNIFSRELQAELPLFYLNCRMKIKFHFDRNDYMKILVDYKSYRSRFFL